MKVSVILCTHNPRRPVLERVLDSLKKQTLSWEEWEFLLVDNASQVPLADEWDLSGLPHARHLREEQLGLTPARLCGIAEAAGSILVFVDDDNFLEPAYLAKALDIAQRWPILGAWGGRILPEFERTPPEWTRPYWSYLAIRDCPHDQWSNFPDQFQGVPYGAGLVIRRHIALVYAALLTRDPVRMLLDRKGKLLTSGGDTDMVLTGCDLGYGAAQLSSLKLTHFMPAGRLEKEYLIRIVEGIAYSGRIHDAIRGSAGAKPSRLRQLRQYLAGWRLPPRDRWFWHAQVRGVRLAERFIDEHPELQVPRDGRQLARQMARELGYSDLEWNSPPLNREGNSDQAQPRERATAVP